MIGVQRKALALFLSTFATLTINESATMTSLKGDKTDKVPKVLFKKTIVYSNCIRMGQGFIRTLLKES